MITYAERVCFRPQHLWLLKYVERLVARVSTTWGNELRCHELARAVQIVCDAHMHMRWGYDGEGVIEDIVRLDVLDGKCGPVEHSWLRFPDGVILDPYVPGRLPSVQLVDPIVGIAYRPGEQRHDIRFEIVGRLIRELDDR
jgi:hypothetical protein